MTGAEHQQVIDRLEEIIVATRETMWRFEVSGMEEAMAEDYEKLQAIYIDAVRDQRAHSLAMLETSELEAS